MWEGFTWPSGTKARGWRAEEAEAPVSQAHLTLAEGAVEQGCKKGTCWTTGWNGHRPGSPGPGSWVAVLDFNLLKPWSSCLQNGAVIPTLKGC